MGRQYRRALQALLAAALMATAAAHAGPEIRFALDPVQGFHYSSEVTTSFGYVTFLQIGRGASAELQPDIAVRPGGQAYPAVVGVLKSVHWAGGRTDPLLLTLDVSAIGEQHLRMMQAHLTDTSVQLAFAVYAFDPGQHGWYTALSSPTGAALAGLLTASEPRGPLLTIDQAPDQAVGSPKSFAVELQVTPATTAQALTLCEGTAQCTSRPWGLSVKP